MMSRGRIRLVKLAALGACTLAGLGLGGCNQGNANLVEMNRALQDRNQALTAQNESLTNLNQQLQDALAAREAALREQADLIARIRGGDSDAIARLRELEERMRGLSFGQMDPATDSAMRDLASQYSELLEWDSEAGLLRFKSDLTFASGSDVVSDSGRSALQQLAGILNGAARTYDLRVVGHTDAQRISAGTAKRHPTNVHLSAHRAISTRDVLVNAGVSPDRVEVAGRGEFDPLVPNTGSGNTPQNRRVEIYLERARPRRAAIGSYSMDSGRSAPAPSRPAMSEQPEVMK